jgi:phage head maturation protease
MEVKFQAVDKEKRIVTGPALIPKKLIYRKDDGDGFYIYFTEDTIEKASQLYLKDGNQFNTTMQHENEVHGVTLVESWIKVDEKDKATALGFDVPDGTWMVSLKVDNDDVWNNFIKTGKVKGFSIEGVFSGKVVQQQKEEDKEKVIVQKIKELLEYAQQQK